MPYQYGSKEDWSYNLLEKCAHNIDYLAEHVYPYTDREFDAASQEWVAGDLAVIDRVRKTPNRIKAAVEAMAEYEKRLPHLKDRKITLAIDEWTGGGRGDFSRSLAAWTLNLFWLNKIRKALQQPGSYAFRVPRPRGRSTTIMN